jgi:LPS-assembly lipoprotein
MIEVMTMNFLSTQVSARKFLLAIALLGVLLVSACGFHLRGPVNLPYKTMYLNGTMTQELRLYLNRYLKTTVNTAVVSNPQEAELLLNINETIGKQILSYNSAGQITAYRIVASVNFTVTNSQGDELIEPSNLFITRDMDFSISTPTASGELEALLVTDMRQDIVSQIARRLATLQKKPAPVLAPTIQ